MKRPKLQLNVEGGTGALIKHLLPFVNLVSTRADRDLAINLLGFQSPSHYVLAVTQDKRYGDMLAIILFLFMLDDYEERKVFWDRISFSDRFLESRLSQLCGMDLDVPTAHELNEVWDLKFPY